nr:est/smg-like protein 1 [Quercus suber]
MSRELSECEDQQWTPPDFQGTTSNLRWRGHDDRSSLRQAPIGHDGAGVCSPVHCHSPSSQSLSSENESMDDHKGNLTPPDSDSLGQNVPFRELSLEDKSTARVSAKRPQRPCKAGRSGNGILSATAASRRTVGSESWRATSQRSPARDLHVQPAGIRKPHLVSSTHVSRGHHVKAPITHNASIGHTSALIDHDGNYASMHAQDNIRQPSRVDSGYKSLPSRQSTLQHDDTTRLPDPDALPKRQTTIIQVSGRGTFPGLILQPDSSPISEEQLQAEVKGIYHGLLMVEAKCINIDTAQAADPNTTLGAEQWQALIALHRTLLYEHHDFLMATQHPSSTPMLRGLAMKYSMPARMWKHGIHAFLEVLRRRRPASQDYMVSFIYMAYQMIALLYETVPIFLDTWIECLGDLARYRMAIEPDKEAHAQWGAVAARWYTMAADRYPQIGRLNHHLGILERPSLRKFCYYAKSLNCILPFLNARDSLTTLCTPIIQDEQTIQNSSSSAEACVVTFQALIYANKPYQSIDDLASTAVLLLIQLPSPKFQEIGVYLAVSNVAALFDLGNPSNPLWQIYESAYRQLVEHPEPSNSATPVVASATPSKPSEADQPSPATSRPFVLRRDFCYNCANSLIRGEDDLCRIQDLLPFVHIMCMWLHSLFNVQSRLIETDTHSIDTISSLLDGEIFSWGGLADFLNSLSRFERMQLCIVQAAKNGNLSSLGERPGAFTSPLLEDHLARGLQWTQSYFPEDHFHGSADDDSRHLDIDGGMTKARMQRVLWLGMYFAHHTDYLQYDEEEHLFVAPALGPLPIVAVPPELSTAQPAAAPTSPASTTSERSVEDGYTIVTRTIKHMPKKQSSPAKKVVSGRRVSKHTQADVKDVKIVGEMAAEMEWEAT